MDRAGPFADGNELGRFNAAMFGMGPAHQRFGPGNGAIAQAADRLECRRKLTAVQRVSEVVSQADVHGVRPRSFEPARSGPGRHACLGDGDLTPVE
jgi:hypothetical protein